MSYAQQSASAHDAALVELLAFASGTQTWRYTSRSTPVTWGGHTWEPVALRRGEIEHGTQIGRASLQLELPLLHPFAQRVFGYGSDAVHSVILWRGHVGDADFQVHWRGRVAASRPTEAALVLECETVFVAMRRTGARQRYSRACRHVLYGRGCGVDRALHAVAGTITAIDGLVLTCPAAAALDDAWLAGGMLQTADGTLRYVAGHTGDQLLVWREVPDLAAGVLLGPVSVTLYPGCAGDLQTCEDKFDNLLNHGGFPLIPTRNPMGGSSVI